MFEILKRLLELDPDEWKHSPDFKDVIDWLGLDETATPEDIQEAIEMELDAQDAEDAASGEGET